MLEIQRKVIYFGVWDVGPLPALLTVPGSSGVTTVVLRDHVPCWGLNQNRLKWLPVSNLMPVCSLQAVYHILYKSQHHILNMKENVQ